MKKQPKTSLGKRGALGISTGANAVINVIMVLISLSCLLPILLIYVSSFTAESAIRAHGFSLFPKEWSLSAYQMLFEESLAQIVVSYRNTAVLTVVGGVVRCERARQGGR